MRRVKVVSVSAELDTVHRAVEGGYLRVGRPTLALVEGSAAPDAIVTTWPSTILVPSERGTSPARSGPTGRIGE